MKNKQSAGKTKVLLHWGKSDIIMISLKPQIAEMADVLIRNIDEETLSRLKEKASFNKRSLQGELKKALEEYAGPSREEIVNRIEKIRERFIRQGVEFPDSAEEIRKMRDRG